MACAAAIYISGVIVIPRCESVVHPSHAAHNFRVDHAEDHRDIRDAVIKTL